jgi:hypothetical protein
MNDPWVLTREKLAWKNMTSIANDVSKRNEPLVLSSTDSKQILYTVQGRAIKYSGKATMPPGLYFSAVQSCASQGHMIRKVMIGNGPN